MRLAALLAVMAGPLCAEPLTSATCENIAALLRWHAFTLSGAPMLTAEGCSQRDVAIATREGMTIKIGMLSIGGQNFNLDDPLWLTFDSLQLTLRDIRFASDSGSPGLDWALGLQDERNGIKMTADLVRAGEKGWRVSEGLIDFPGDNAISVTFSAPAADLSSRAAASFSMASLRVSEARLKITTHGLFETYALIPMTAAFFADSADPQGEFTALRDDVLSGLDELSPEALDDKAKAELRAFVTDLPKPDGELTIAFGGDLPPLYLLSLLTMDTTDPIEIANTFLRGTDPNVTWERVD